MLENPPPRHPLPELLPHERFAGLDIYLFDQLVRGRIAPGQRIFDAGCGSGRNVSYLLAAGYEVMGVDREPAAIEAVRTLAAALAPALPARHFRAEALEATTFPAACADIVICNAVLHFAADDEEFRNMLLGAWRVLAPDGLFFCRLASTIGMEGRFHGLGGRRFALPDGTERYLVDAPLLTELTAELGGSLVDPLKTTVVQDLRCMTTWVVRKTGRASGAGIDFGHAKTSGPEFEVGATCGSVALSAGRGGPGARLRLDRLQQLGAARHHRAAGRGPDGRRTAALWVSWPASLRRIAR